MSWYSITIQDNLDFHFLASQIILKIPFASSSVKIHTIKKHVKKIFKIPLFHCCFTFFERLCSAALLMQVRVDYLAFTYLSWPEGSVRIGGKHFPKDRAKRWQRGGEAICSPTRLNEGKIPEACPREQIDIFAEIYRAAKAILSNTKDRKVRMFFSRKNTEHEEVQSHHWPKNQIVTWYRCFIGTIPACGVEILSSCGESWFLACDWATNMLVFYRGKSHLS